MTLRIALATTALLITAPCFAQKVHVDYDRAYDFSAIETYAWIEPERAEEEPLIERPLAGIIDHWFATMGARRVDAGADVVVAYEFATREQQEVTTTHVGYGYGRGWYGYGYGRLGNSWTAVSSRMIQALVVDIRDPGRDSSIWRGTAEAAVFANPAKNERKIDNAVRKLSRKWEKRVARDAAQRADGEPTRVGR